MEGAPKLTGAVRLDQVGLLPGGELGWLPRSLPPARATAMPSRVRCGRTWSSSDHGRGGPCHPGRDHHIPRLPVSVARYTGDLSSARRAGMHVARKVTTAAELEQMTPAERHEHFEASVVTDLSQIPPEYLVRIRTELEAQLAKRNIPNAS